MTQIRVDLGERSYRVCIGAGLLDQASRQLAPFVRNGRFVIVTDETVWDAQGPRLVAGLGLIEAVPVVVAAGESAKSWDTLSALVDRLVALRVERGEPILAFGGGVIGDLAGFAAAVYKRGISYLQIPTSLLAQVDSSVGGKTAINTAAGKNLVGAFHQPAMVLVDINCLATLYPRQFRAGYAEILKYALIEDASFFGWLDANAPAILAREPAALHHALTVAIRGKARIVAEDERETGGRRALLNLGHTFAHALEAELGYDDRLLHGEAVAVGLVLAFQLSAARGHCPPEAAIRVRDHLRRLGLPVSPLEAGVTASPERLVDHMLSDKKMENGQLAFILARDIGRAFVDRTVDLVQVAELLGRS